MKKISAVCLSVFLLLGLASAQTPQQRQKPQVEMTPEDVVRITTDLVQTDVVVTDKNDQTIGDLRIEDFELYDNGKKQDIKFLEFVSVDTGKRVEGTRPAPAPVDIDRSEELSAAELKRVVAFVVDDLTIPFADMAAVRQMLRDFVDNQMKPGDLVAIVRVVGGKGLLQQFTSDKQLLRRAIAQLNVSTHPFAGVNNPNPSKLTGMPAPFSAEGGGGADDISLSEPDTRDLTSNNDETQRYFRGLFALSSANFVIESLKQIPGHKSLVLISGGIPIFETGSSGTVFSNVSYLLQQLTDSAVRAGVVINTLDPRGLKATPGVLGYDQTPARSGLSGVDPTFGRGGVQDQAVFGAALAGGDEHLSLSTLAATTGGLAVFNTNNFKEGLDKILARSKGYYLLAYTPSERFDNKFHKIQIKVKRPSVRVYNHAGFVAREDKGSDAPPTHEQAVMAAARSPLAKREVDVSANVSYKFLANKADLGIHVLIDTNKLHSVNTPDGRYQVSFDVVGFLFDQIGKLRGGFSETVNANLTSTDYQRAQDTGLTYSASTQLPPGYYQLRIVVREVASGNLGSYHRYLEVPDLTNGKLAMSSIFLYAVEPAASSKTAPEALLALRRISPKRDLRYASIVYNAKQRNGKTQLRTQLLISQGPNVLFQEPEQALEANADSQTIKVGQVALAKVRPGRYVLTLIVTDTLADKKYGTVSRSIDFTVVD